MKTYLKLIIFLFAIGITLGFKTDETPLEKLLKQLAKITANFPQEKVHLHLDKPIYAVGEDIWLKAYLVTAEKNEPSLLSKVLYIDLINEKGEIKKKTTFEVLKGFADGNIRLTDSLTAGTYRIRAYTNYMRNYDQSLFFEKFVAIGNVAYPVSAAAEKEKKIDFKLQFFPEGGNLIAGIRSKIGVKAVSSEGLGANLSGYVENSAKEKVAIFTTEHAGMGAFALAAQAGENYTAIVTLPNGTVKSFSLPKPQPSGLALAVNQIDENVNIRIASLSSTLGS